MYWLKNVLFMNWSKVCLSIIFLSKMCPSKKSEDDFFVPVFIDLSPIENELFDYRCFSFVFTNHMNVAGEHMLHSFNLGEGLNNKVF